MRIGLAGWSLSARFKAGRLTLPDYPRTAKEEFGLSVIELNAPFFESPDEKYLKTLADRIRTAGSVVANIAVDGQGDLASLDEPKRRDAVKKHAGWFHVAQVLGSPCIRAFTGGPHEGQCSPALLDACIRSFQELAAQGKKHGKKIIIENHGGVIACDPDNLVKIMQSDASGFLGMCPDFGNFPAEVRYEGLQKVSPWAVALHAKMHDFNADGAESKIDVGRCIEIFRKSGYDGDVLIEYEGKQLSDHDGVRKGIALLKRFI